MAKKKRNLIGEVIKNKEQGKAPYIKVKKDVTLTNGQTLSLESKKKQIEGVQSAMTSGKLSEDLGSEILERLEKIPDFVMYQIILLEDA
jgi:hypothetical protein